MGERQCVQGSQPVASARTRPKHTMSGVVIPPSRRHVRMLNSSTSKCPCTFEAAINDRETRDKSPTL
eukprot:4656356-Amphidinium_carterae.1